MPLQDLTPQLRTRLTRLERVVGLFVLLATLLMLAGLGYYIYKRAERKGWFLQKMPFYTFVRNAGGLKVGDKVKLMGFDAGEILEITPMPPDADYDVFVQFHVREPYFGYLWESSHARVAAADFLGNRTIETTKGTNGAPIYLFSEFKDISVREAGTLIDREDIVFGQDVHDGNRFVVRATDKITPKAIEALLAAGTNTVQVVFRNRTTKSPTAMWDDQAGRYQPYDPNTKGYYLTPDESPALTDRLEQLVNLVETNLPNILELTNRIAAALGNAANAAQRADTLLAGAVPVVSNLNTITAHLQNPRGSLGEWLLPTNLNQQVTQALASANRTLGSANTAITNTDERLSLLVSNLNTTLENLSGITSNLHGQVLANSNIVSSVNNAIIHGDEFIQGLKRHWLLRSAFKTKATNTVSSPPSQTKGRLRSPRDSQ